jgi:hexosaminidase
MNKLVSLVLIAIFFMACTEKKYEVKEYNKGINIVPLPVSITQQEGVFKLNKKTVLVVKGDGAETVANFFIGKISNSTGFNLNVKESASANSIAMTVDASSGLADEGYKLNVTPKSVTILASTDRGLFYGMQSLLQLLPAEIESPVKVSEINWNIPAVTIEDLPRFKWRGMHLDVCRHFYSVDFIKKQLDVLAMYKVNKFHLHLTEDQGWRIEIKKYPKLTEIGSKRIDEGKEHGGFYTQEDIKEIVAYAAERHIDVVPEIELPGHALAALTAYPEYSCSGGPFKVRNVWGVEPDIYCAGKEETFEFLENIIEEVVALFPSEYFHIGGDEAPKSKWKECDLCQARIKAEGLKDEHELQSYFVQRIEKVLKAHGKKMIGWDEILEGGLAESALVMSWRGEKGGIEAATLGHDVIMTPGNWVYLDHYQGSSKVEPVGIGGYTTMEESYGYEPVPAELDKGKAKHILGTQGNVWSEYMYTPELVEYRVYPRIIALAEVGWTQPEKKDFDGFVKRMDNQFVRLDMHNVNYHIPLPEGPINTIAITDKGTTLDFTTTRPVDMYYTLDGTEPTLESEKYTTPLQINESTTIKIRTALVSGKMSTVRTINVVKQVPVEAIKTEAKNKGLKLKIAEGEFYSTKEIAGIKNWTETVAKTYKATNHMFDYHKPSVGILEGYLEIPEDGIYHFSSDMDELYVGGVLLISNDGEVKRFSRNDASIALNKGLQPVKIVVINNVFGGWPQIWNGIRIKYKNVNDEDFTELRPENFVY